MNLRNEIANDYFEDNKEKIGLKFQDPIYREKFIEFFSEKSLTVAESFNIPIYVYVQSKIAEYDRILNDLEKNKTTNNDVQINDYLKGIIEFSDIKIPIDTEKLMTLDPDLVNNFFLKIKLDPLIENQEKIQIQKIQFSYIRNLISEKKDTG